MRGQTAAIFKVRKGEAVKVSIIKGRVKVRRRGVSEDVLTWDRAAFLEDPEAAIDDLLAQTDANVFRILTGANQQLRILTRANLKKEIFALMDRYSEENLEDYEYHYGEWLNGIVAFPGTTSRGQSRMQERLSRQVIVTKELKRKSDAKRASLVSPRTAKQLRARLRRDR